MANENYSVREHEEKGKCLICGKETSKFVFAGNDSGGTTTYICDECGHNIITHLTQDENFRKIAPVY